MLESEPVVEDMLIVETLAEEVLFAPEQPVQEDPIDEQEPAPVVEEPVIVEPVVEEILPVPEPEPEPEPEPIIIPEVIIPEINE